MVGYIDVTSLDAIPDEAGRAFAVGRHVVALFRSGGVLYALDDACMHCGASLAGGAVASATATVTCVCGWSYELATGHAHSIPGLHQDAFAVRVKASRVEVARTCRRPLARAGER